MSDKIELLRLAFKKASGEKNHMAFFLEEFRLLEKLTNEELLSTLNCSYENLLRLGLCIIPEQSSDKFIEKINNISENVNISALSIITIIKHVVSVTHFTNTLPESMLMAARDKEKKKDSSD